MGNLKLHVSWLFFALGAYWGATSVPQGKLGAGLLVGYVVWSLFWGVPPVWRWWRAKGHQHFAAFQRGTSSWALRTALSFAFLMTAAYFVSVFGGGLYHFLKCLRRARSPS
jgi:hypothetical protein